MNGKSMGRKGRRGPGGGHHRQVYRRDRGYPGDAHPGVLDEHRPIDSWTRAEVLRAVDGKMSAGPRVFCSEARGVGQERGGVKSVQINN